MTSDIPEEIYRTIQTTFRATPALLIGSGFSCGYKLPHMGALGEHLSKTVGPKLTSKESRAIWAAALDAIQNNLEEGLNTIASGAKGREEIISILREETADLIISKTLAAELEILSATTPSDHAPARLLSKLFYGAPQNSECISVITTNYDTLLELFCDIANLPLDTGFSGYRRRRPRTPSLFQTNYIRSLKTGKKGQEVEHKPCLKVRLLKPHGSITWHTTDKGPIEVTNDYASAPKAIIVPGPTKYQDALVNTLFDEIRTEMNNTIQKANALICIGFGFNDDHLQGVIKSRLDNHMPMILITRDLTQNIRATLKKYPHIIAFCSKDTGSECHHNEKIIASMLPLWELDTFLKIFLE